MIAAGIGCRSVISTEQVQAAIEAALDQCSRPGRALTVLAVPAAKGGTPALSRAAATRGIPLLLIPQDLLQAASPLTLTRSSRALAAMHVHCVAEAAALAGAGKNARLLAPRIAVGPVTCALAESDGSP